MKTFKNLFDETQDVNLKDFLEGVFVEYPEMENITYIPSKESVYQRVMADLEYDKFPR